MKYFVAENGLIASIAADSSSNLPVLANGECRAEIKANKLALIGSDGEVIDEYDLWDNLVSLAVAINSPVQHDPSQPLDVTTAVDMAHERLELFRDDWIKGHAEQPDDYPLTIPADNSGILFEQMSDYIFTDPSLQEE